MELGDLTEPWRVEQLRRSVAMCNPDVPMLTNADVNRLLVALADALAELRRLRRWCGLDQQRSQRASNRRGTMSDPPSAHGSASVRRLLIALTIVLARSRRTPDRSVSSDALTCSDPILEPVELEGIEPSSAER